MLKKTMALVLTLVMTAALAVPMVALAANPSSDYDSSDVSSADNTVFSSGTSGKSTTVYKSQTDVPTLNLTITGGGGLVMNPYGIARNTTAFGLDNIGGVASDTNQIISTKMMISSNTIVPVLVGATVKTELEGDKTLALATGKLTASDKTKKVALWLVAWGSGTDDTQFKTFTRQTTNATGKTGTNAQAGVLFVKNPKTDNANPTMYTIPAGTSTTATTCYLQFFGDMVAEPLNNPWTTDDKITPTLVLDFQLQKVAATTTASTGG